MACVVLGLVCVRQSFVAVLVGTDQLHWPLVTASPILTGVVGVCLHKNAASAVVVW